MMNGEQLRATVATVDLARLKNNLRLIREMVGPEVAITAVVKANGYGLGARGIARALMDAGASYLAVATLSEALELREDGDYPLFILGHTPDEYLHYVVDQQITQTIFTLSQAQALSALAVKAGKCATVHIKVDTGFHRLGQMPSPAFADEIAAMFMLPGLNIEGIFSHLALVNREENEKQYHAFCDFIQVLEARGCTFRYRHIADSIACVDYPEYRMNMIRPGALLYGMRGFHIGFLPVDPALTFSTRISQLHTVAAGEGVSYDYLWKASRPSLIATLPFGYADGYPRNLRDKGYVTIRGRKAPLVGVLCMDQCMADVTDVPDVQVGDTAVIYGDGANGTMSVQEACDLSGTNKNDIISRLSPRVAKVYING